MAQAARFIREHISRGIKVEDVALAVNASRRVLEPRFVRALGRTPHDEIVRIRFRLVEELPQTTDLELAVIAHRCGFRHAEHMTAAFARRHGTSPSQWRRMNRRRSPAAAGGFLRR
ncbi:MAG: helix-turn-helix domain-containing protein [Planctomycetaceae bacterium]